LTINKNKAFFSCFMRQISIIQLFVWPDVRYPTNRISDPSQVQSYGLNIFRNMMNWTSADQISDIRDKYPVLLENASWWWIQQNFVTNKNATSHQTEDVLITVIETVLCWHLMAFFDMMTVHFRSKFFSPVISTVYSNF